MLAFLHVWFFPNPFPAHFQATLDGAEVSRGAEAQAQADVLLGLLGRREEDPRVLGQATDVEVGQLVGRHDLWIFGKLGHSPRIPIGDMVKSNCAESYRQHIVRWCGTGAVQVPIVMIVAEFHDVSQEC